MKTNSISTAPNFKGIYIFDTNLTYSQMRNFRLALKEVDIYKKEYDLKIFNDLSYDKLCKKNEHFVCVTAENTDKRQSAKILIEPDEQKRGQIIKEKVLKVARSFEKKYPEETFFDKLKNIFHK